MKTVALIGKIDIENFGDLLLAKIFVDWLKVYRLRVICPGVPQGIVQQIGADSDGSFAESDLILYIGGGYFGEQPGTFRQRMSWGNGKLKSTLLPGLQAMVRRKPVAVIGPGYGPISNIATRLASLVLIGGAKIRSLRDSESVNYYKGYGGKKEILETADCALTLAGSALSQEAVIECQRWRESTGTRKLIGVHLTRQAVDHPGGELILREVQELTQNDKYQVVFFNDQRGTAGARATDLQYEQLAGANAGILPYTTMDKLIGFLDACDLVITAKLHVGIVAVTRKTPVLAFPYHSKTRRFYNQIGRPDLCLPYTDWTAGSIKEKFQKIPGLVQTPIALPQPLVERAGINRSLVEQFIENYSGETKLEVA